MADLKRLPDLDLTKYDDLAKSFRTLSGQLKTSATGRVNLLKTEALGWVGEAAGVFAGRFNQGFTDAQELAGALDAAADLVDKGDMSMRAAAERENRRRQAARNYLDLLDRCKQEHPPERHWYDPTTWFSADDWEGRVEKYYGAKMPSPIPEPMLSKDPPPGNPTRQS